jgi:O-acetylserine/cysteine efflux transporter
MMSRDILLAILPPTLWAVAYAVAKPATAHFPPLFLMSLAYALTAATLFRPSLAWRTPSWAIILGATLGGSVQSALIFSGIARVPATLAILVVQSQVPFAVLAAWAIGRERLSVRRLIGIAVSLGGVAFVVGTPGPLGETGGLLLIVCGTLSWGAAQGVIRHASRDPGDRLMGAMALLAAPQLLIMSLLLETGQLEAVKRARWLDWAALIALALGGFAAAYAIWYGLLRRYRVDQIAPFALLMPIIGVLVSAIMLGEKPSAAALGGGVIILIGLVLVVGTRHAPARQITADSD